MLTYVEGCRRTAVIVRFNERPETSQLTLLRAEPGSDPPSANSDHRKTNKPQDISP
jgi:hypothetical protein